MKKLSKIAQVTFFAAAFAVLFSGTADAYIDPSVMRIWCRTCYKTGIRPAGRKCSHQSCAA